MTHYTASGAGKRRPLPSYNTLRENFSLDAESPSGLRWAKGRNAGKAAGTATKDGYYRVALDGEKFQTSRIVASLARAETLTTDEIVLYVDGDSGNNAADNLKVVSNRSVIEGDATTTAEGLYEKTFNGETLYELRAVGGYLMGRFTFLRVAIQCQQAIAKHLDMDGDIAKQLSIISKRYLSEDRSRLHLATNQY